MASWVHWSLVPQTSALYAADGVTSTGNANMIALSSNGDCAGGATCTRTVVVTGSALDPPHSGGVHMLHVTRLGTLLFACVSFVADVSGLFQFQLTTPRGRLPNTISASRVSASIFNTNPVVVRSRVSASIFNKPCCGAVTCLGKRHGFGVGVNFEGNRRHPHAKSV